MEFSSRWPPKEGADNQRYWPHSDEYCRDGLGTYLYTLTEGCAEQRAAS